jgi:NAD(P)-dependent dehydrogenase (short-subunit alcohol dehydrogenase family)
MYTDGSYEPILLINKENEKHDQKLKKDNNMKTIVITGATSGIGLASALELAKNNFNIVGVGRDPERCGLAKEQILKRYPDVQVAYFAADLMQQREVNNAGCARSWYTTTEEGYEQLFALNHLAGFLMTYRLLPYLIKASGRVIMTGSESHQHMRVRWDDLMFQRGYHPLLAYKQSKLCNILFAKALNDRYGWQGLHAYTVDPGLVRTEIGCKNTGGIVSLVWNKRKNHGVSPDVPAKTYAFLCEEESAPKELYYHLCNPKRYSEQVDWQNAGRLFRLSETLCGIHYDERMLEL